jgi:hypothetical protein
MLISLHISQYFQRKSYQRGKLIRIRIYIEEQTTQSPKKKGTNKFVTDWDHLYSKVLSASDENLLKS